MTSASNAAREVTGPTSAETSVAAEAVVVWMTAEAEEEIAVIEETMTLTLAEGRCSFLNFVEI